MGEGLIGRSALKLLEKSLKNMPMTAILGPRQCGKTTLVRQVADESLRHFFQRSLDR